MPSRQTFTMTGFKELEAALKGLGEEVATKAGATATRKAANIMRDEVKKGAPFDDGPTVRVWKNKDGGTNSADYGHLRDNIKTRKVRARKAHTLAYEISTTKAFWGRFSEFGTEHEGAKPWFKPVLDRSAGQVVSTLQSELKKAIDRAARKARK